MSTRAISEGNISSADRSLHEPTPHHSTLTEVVKRIFERIVDLLVLIWYAIQYPIQHILTIDLFGSSSVFKGQILCTTANHAKFSDLPQYVALRRNPTQFPLESQTRCAKMGFTSPDTPLFPRPFTNGHCNGNVTVFLKKWLELETPNIELIIPEFKNGSSILGAFYQECYLQQYTANYYPELCELIKRVIQSYPTSTAQERVYWATTPFEKVIIIFDAIETYLKEGRHPKEGGFTEFIQAWLEENNKDTILDAHHFATVRYVAESYEKQLLSERDRLIAYYSNVELSVEKIFYLNNGPGDVLGTISQLDPGAYELTMPTFDSFGSRKGIKSHTVGLIIDPKKKCYILDSNIAIGWMSYDELPQTVGRLFTRYTGFDYSEDYKGRAPPFWRKATNWLFERANPSATLLNKGFVLVKISK